MKRFTQIELNYTQLLHLSVALSAYRRILVEDLVNEELDDLAKDGTKRALDLLVDIEKEVWQGLDETKETI